MDPDGALRDRFEERLGHAQGRDVDDRPGGSLVVIDAEVRDCAELLLDSRCDDFPRPSATRPTHAESIEDDLRKATGLPPSARREHDKDGGESTRHFSA